MDVCSIAMDVFIIEMERLGWRGWIGRAGQGETAKWMGLCGPPARQAHTAPAIRPGRCESRWAGYSPRSLDERSPDTVLIQSDAVQIKQTPTFKSGF